MAAIERHWHIGARSNVERSVTRVVFNAAPTQSLPVLRLDPERGMVLESFRWGLVPSWAKDSAIGARMINARAETAAGKPAFRAAFRRRRCLVPMMGFYEWRKTAAGKVPYYVRLLNAEAFGVAGLYEYWPGQGGNAALATFAILTTGANALMAQLHDRMPVILAEQDHAAWLDPARGDMQGLQPMLKPYPADEMTAYPVGKRVNSPKNDDATLIEPVEE